MNLKYFLCGFLLTITLLANAEPRPVYDWKIIKVIDGDTVKFEANFLPDPLRKQLNLRVLGIDTPEKGKRAECDSERELSKKASQFTKDFIASGKPYILLENWGKFGGRVLGDVIVDEKRLSAALIDAGLARPYDGGKKESWCE